LPVRERKLKNNKNKIIKRPRTVLKLRVDREIKPGILSLVRLLLLVTSISDDLNMYHYIYTEYI